jgi:phosphotransferase system  glucose/maltose/N-acetylglucosamine-specific IIC component
MSSEILKSKYPIVAGGFFGFLLTFVLGHRNGNEITTCLAYASMTAAVFAYLMRMFVRMLDSNIKAVRYEKEKEILEQIKEEQRKQEEEREKTKA